MRFIEVIIADLGGLLTLLPVVARRSAKVRQET